MPKCHFVNGQGTITESRPFDVTRRRGSGNSNVAVNCCAGLYLHADAQLRVKALMLGSITSKWEVQVEEPVDTKLKCVPLELMSYLKV